MYQYIDEGNVSMPNGIACKIVAIDSVKIQTHDGMFYTLNEVIHVPLMTKSLISFSVLDSKGYSFQVKGRAIYVYKVFEVVLRGTRHGTLYLLSGSTIIVYATVALSLVYRDDIAKLWHMGLGHMIEKRMQILPKRDLLCGHKVQHVEFCEHCNFLKLHQSKFSKGVHCTKETLDYIHSDC